MLKKIIATLFTKGFIAIINLVILLVSAKQLGADIRGQINLLILNIAIVQAINEIYTGYALVYFIPKFSLKKIYLFGLLWTLGCTGIVSIFFSFFHIGIKEQLIHVCILSFLIILHSFHGVIILARQKIKMYNFLNFFQPIVLLFLLCLMIYIYNIRTANSYIIALYVSFLSSFILSSIGVIGIFKIKETLNKNIDAFSIVKSGFYNQVANLSYMLSNRFNVYLLSNTMLVGIFSSATSLIESVLIISSSASTIILTRTANEEETTQHINIIFLLSKLCFVMSCICTLILVLIPNSFFIFLLGPDFIQIKQIMLLLSPGILFVSFSTVISHYFAGRGKQKQIAMANIVGFITTILSSFFLVPRYGLTGACFVTCTSYLISSLILVTMFMKQHRLKLSAFINISDDLKLLRKSR